MAQRHTQETRYRETKADYDSKMSYYNIAIEHYGRADDKLRVKLDEDLKAKRKELDRLQEELIKAQNKLDETALAIRDMESKEVEIAHGGEPVNKTLEAA